MARRNRDLAGLAALGALGLYMGRDGNKGAGRGVGEGRKESVESETRRQTPARDEDDRDIGMISGASPSGLYRNTESGDLFSVNRPEEAVSTPRQRPVVRTPGGNVAPAAANRSMAKANQESYKNPQRGPSFEEISAYNRSQQTAGTSTKPREGVAQASTRSMTPARPQTREEAIAQIPTSTGSRVVASDADASLRVDEDEASRNIGNALSALPGGAGLKGMHRLAKGLANRPARQLALPAPAVRPEVRGAGEGFVMYKKGGAVKAKKMASGGMTSKPSSASSRADGIASRGKTKCKMY